MLSILVLFFCLAVFADRADFPSNKDNCNNCIHCVGRLYPLRHSYRTRHSEGVCQCIQRAVRCIAHSRYRTDRVQITVELIRNVKRQHLRAAGTNCQITVHIPWADDCVCNDSAMEAPFITQNVRQKSLTATGPDRTDRIHRGHNAHAACLDRLFKRLEINFAGRLFIQPCADVILTIVVLIVEGKMLHIANQTIFGCAGHLCSCGQPGENAALGIVFKVTPAECAAVDIHCRCIPACAVDFSTFFCNLFTARLGQRLVPGASQHHRTGIARTCGRIVVAVYTGRTITVLRCGQADGFNTNGMVTTICRKAEQVIDREFIEKLLPLGVIVSNAGQISKFQPVIRPGGRHHSIGVIVFCRIKGCCTCIVCQCLCTQAMVCRRSGSLCIVGKAIGTAEIGHISLRKGKLVCSSHLICGASAIMFIVIDDVLVHLGNIGIQDRMRIRAEIDLIVACLEYIRTIRTLDAVRIIGGHILITEGDLQGLCFAGLQDFRLGVLHKICCCLFDATVIIRRLIENFCNIFSCCIAGIFNCYIQRDFLAIILDSCN